MRQLKGILIGLGLIFSGHAAAQAVDPGWYVDWGVRAPVVPLSPWVAALLVGLLSLAAFAFLRKRAHGGLMMLAVTIVAGGLTAYSTDRILASLSTHTYFLNSASGSEFFS